MKRCALFLGGDIFDYEVMKEFLLPEDTLVAVDGGARHLIKMGLKAHLLIGDMDSIAPEDLAKMTRSGTVLKAFKPEKDETDGELAIDSAIGLGAKEVVILGVQGERMDHFLAVLSLLYRLLKAGVRGKMISESQTIWLIEKREVFDLPAGAMISFLPFGNSAGGVTLKGFKYPLVSYQYVQGKPIGISNAIETPPAEATLDEGILIVIHTRKI